MPTQFVQKDKGGTVYHDVIDAASARWDASPTPTVTLYTAKGSELVASQNATEGPSTTLTATAAAKQSTLQITSASSINVGDVLLLGPNDSGQWEWVTVDSVIGGSTLTLTTRDPLVYSYVSADVIKSCRLSVSMSSSEADGVYESCRAEWVFSVSSQSRIETSIFHVSVFSPRMTLRDQDILIRQPRARDLLGTRQRLSQLIKDIWERDILEDLGAVVNPGALVAGDVLRQAHMYRVLAEIASMASDEESRDRYFEHYRTSWDRIMQQTLIDTDGDGAIGDDDIIRTSMTGRVKRA
ncbi:MAG: hypothetical protein ACYTBJ_01150 [Planctomycetota bacterium]|jgi:hypothetical protein